MAEFRKCYYVEIKSFYIDELNVHRQMADMSTRPILYTKLTSAGARLEHAVKNFTEEFGYRIIEYQNTLRDVRKGLIYTCKLFHDEHKVELYISVMDSWLIQH